MEATAGVEWVPADVARLRDWGPLLEDVDVVINLAWYRWGNATKFRHLYEGLHALLETCRAMRVDRFLQVSVPDAPASLEARLPYLTYKRRFDRELLDSGLSARVVRPTMMFAPQDRLLTVMLGLMKAYPWFPMFGDGDYHLSPVAASDVARILIAEASGSSQGTVDAGGPIRYRYRDLTDLMFRALGRSPKYCLARPPGVGRLRPADPGPWLDEDLRLRSGVAPLGPARPRPVLRAPDPARARGTVPRPGGPAARGPGLPPLAAAVEPAG